MIHALHGNLGSPRDWNFLEVPGGVLARDLWNDLEVAPDLGLEEWGEHFAGAVSTRDSDSFLLGYSMGGRLALHAMIAAPEIWKGAIIISAHPGLKSEAERRDRRAADRRWAERVRREDWETFLESWDAQPVLAGTREGGNRDRARLKSRRPAVARAFENWSLGCQRDLRHSLGVCRFPVLWVTGERDAKFTALTEELDTVIPNFESAVIPGCGHRVIFDRPDELAAVIRDFQKRRL